MGTDLSFCPKMDISHDTLVSQGLIDYLEEYQRRKRDFQAAGTIPLPFPVKPYFNEDVLSFESCAPLSLSFQCP